MSSKIQQCNGWKILSITLPNLKWKHFNCSYLKKHRLHFIYFLQTLYRNNKYDENVKKLQRFFKISELTKYDHFTRMHVTFESEYHLQKRCFIYFVTIERNPSYWRIIKLTTAVTSIT